MATKRKKAGRPRLSDTGKGETPLMQIRIPKELTARLDKYRKAQEAKPPRSEVIRGWLDEKLTAAGY